MKRYTQVEIHIISMKRDVIMTSDRQPNTPDVAIDPNTESLYYEGGEFAPNRHRYRDDYSF